jgi:hypothetical protein
MAQDAPAARTAPQLVVIGKFALPDWTLIPWSAVPPWLLSVMVCAALEAPTACAANVSDVGERLSLAGASPDPPSATTCVRLASATSSCPLMLPAVCGVKLTVMVQE